MKLKLRNFRCYENAEFDLGTAGITLISGSSGKGKTTLLMAIEFALFGTGTKLQTHGKKSCSVELELNSNFKIFRQKGPNRLIVNDTYEDDSGEALIKEKFGSNLLSCYIPQNIRKSFILMSPMERLDFLETVAFDGLDISDIKSRTKAIIKKLGDEHTETIGSLKAMKNSLSQLPVPKKITFPINCAKGNEEKTITNEETKRKNREVRIKKCERSIATLKSCLGETKILNAIIKEKETQIKQIRGKIQAIPDCEEPDLEMLEKLKNELQSYLQNKKIIEVRQEYHKNVNLLQSMKDEESRQLQEQFRDLKSKLWQTMSKEETLEQTKLWENELQKFNQKRLLQSRLRDLKIPENTLDALQTVSIDISKQSIELDMLTSQYESQKELYSCPHCSTLLKFDHKQLILSTQTSTVHSVSLEDISSIKKRLESLKMREKQLKTNTENYKKICSQRDMLLLQIDELGDVVDENPEGDLKDMHTYRDENTLLEAQLLKTEKTLKGGLFSSPILQLEKRVMLLKTRLDSTVSTQKETEQTDEEDLRDRIQKIEMSSNIYLGNQQTKKELEHTMKNILNSVEALRQEHIEKWKSLSAVEDIVGSISLKETEMECARDELKKCEENLKAIELYMQSRLENLTYHKFETECVNLETKEEVLRKEYTTACQFRDKILEAESIAISNLIGNINTHAQFYLEHFFPDEPISVRLCAFRETKTSTKPQINLEVDYKGIEHDLTMLSGGEMSRVILAFTLALAEIQNSKFVMLDESTASLDQELTSTVIEGLKENFDGRLVILIAHQVVQGAFDYVVKL